MKVISQILVWIFAEGVVGTLCVTNAHRGILVQNHSKIRTLSEFVLMKINISIIHEKEANMITLHRLLRNLHKKVTDKGIQKAIEQCF